MAYPLQPEKKRQGENLRIGVLFQAASFLLAVNLAGCGQPRPDRSLEVFESTYAPPPAPPYLVRNATILDGLGGEMTGADLLMADGKIIAFGPEIAAPADAVIIDGTGRSLTPGIIDVHTHYGTATLPYAIGSPDHWDVNEASDPVTPQIRIETAFNPQDPALYYALSGGVTTFQVLPGSRNAIGGLGVVMKNVPGPTSQSMKFPGAPYGLKMACGENFLIHTKRRVHHFENVLHHLVLRLHDHFHDRGFFLQLVLRTIRLLLRALGIKCHLLGI